jgi:hypothetical protein
VLAAGAAAPAPSRAAECDGATVRRVVLAPERGVLKGSVTMPGVTHATLAAGGAFRVSVVAAEDPASVLFTASVPATRFITRGKTTKYDRQGDLRGRIVLKASKRQDSTVDLAVALSHVAAALPGRGAHDVRVYLEAGGRCARSCVSRCRGTARRLRCRRSRAYAPPAEAGFGGRLRGRAQATSSLCGLEVRTAAAGCDPLIEESCLLPYPSSHFLRPDPSTPTGLRVAYPATALPRSAAGTPVDPTDWNTLDGFSPGPMLIALFPDTGAPVDLARSGVAFHTDFARSLAPDHPTVLLDAATGERVVHFAEMDANVDDVTKKAFIIRPGRRLADGRRYLVAIRGLVDANGTPIRARAAFRALRDRVPEAEIAAACGAACAAALAARQAAYADILARLEAAGIAPQDLILAWDFTTASTPALTGWMVAVRDQAFALGTPAFGVDRVDTGPAGGGFDADIWARIEGTFEAPLFMTADAPASRLNLVGGVPRQNGFATVPFVVDVPRSAVPDPACTEDCAVRPGRPTLWGHGLLGDRFQLDTLSAAANAYNFVVGAVDMQGMSAPDVGGSLVGILLDLSLFHRIPERLHQGILHHLLLGRLMVDGERGFNSHPAFRFGTPPGGVIDTTAVYYSGGSQGGILGLTVMAVAEDFERGFLAVPGANYSTLLHRSIDFNPFLAVLRATYPDRLDETLLVALVQQLWDRAEPQGYLNHVLAGDLSDPPVPHEVLLHMATHDSEVSNLGTEIMVRSLAIPQLAPVHRTFFDIPEMAAPFDGSAFVEVDPQRAGARCHTPGAADAGAACATDADCPGGGDPPSRTMCASGAPPLTNQAPPFNNLAHRLPVTAAAGMQVDRFFRPDGIVEQFCQGPCDPE